MRRVGPGVNPGVDPGANAGVDAAAQAAFFMRWEKFLRNFCTFGATTARQ